MSVYHIHAVPKEAKEGVRPLKWSYKLLLVSMWVLD